MRRRQTPHSAGRVLRRRLGMVGGALVIGYAGLVARAVQLQAVDGSWLASRAEAQHRATLRLGALRGEIVDRRGELLAVSADTESVAVNPRAVRDRRTTAARLAVALDQRPADVARRLSSGRSFVWVKRWVSPDEADRVRKLGLEGVELRVERRRLYPNRDLAAAYIGFAGRDGVGLTGIELAFDAALRGSASALPALRDARGRKRIDRTVGSETRDGARLVLTLDARLQHQAERALDRALARTGARQGSITVLDPTNGDLLALAERPGFDPNRFWVEVPERFRARALTDPFEPGSTLKPFLFAIALEAGIIDPEELIDCELGSWQVADRVIHDWRPHGLLTAGDVLVHSSNIGAAKVAAILGTQRLVSGLRRFGFGARTESGFPGESRGTVHDLRPSQIVERSTLAYGHGMTTTALQLAVAGAVLANGGREVVPRMALRIEGPEESFELPVGPERRVLSERSAHQTLRLLREAVERGTGRAAQIPGVSVAGKTGTAQKVVNGSYAADRFVASFLGFVPAQRPRLVVVVVLDEPLHPHTGSGAAAPPFRDVAIYATQQLWMISGGSG